MNILIMNFSFLFHFLFFSKKKKIDQETITDLPVWYWIALGVVCVLALGLTYACTQERKKYRQVSKHLSDVSQIWCVYYRKVDPSAKMCFSFSESFLNLF